MGESLFAMAALKINDGPAHVLIFYFWIASISIILPLDSYLVHRSNCYRESTLSLPG